MMSAPTRHPMIEAYLDDLRQAAARLPRSQRAELVAEIAAHVEAGLPSAPTDAEVRNLLDDLGHPDDIVEAAAGPAPSPGAAGAPDWLPLVLGVAGLATMPLPFLGLPLGIAAIVTGVMARRRARSLGHPRGMATAGLILGISAVVLPVAVFLSLFGVSTGGVSEGGEVIDVEVEQFDQLDQGGADFDLDAEPDGLPSDPDSSQLPGPDDR
jgi:hypothetical protein